MIVFGTNFSIFVKIRIGWDQKKNWLNDSRSCLKILPLLRIFGYEKHNKGATSGSRIRFKNEETGQFIDIHRPHPGSIMKHWMMKAIYQHLLDRGLLK